MNAAFVSSFGPSLSHLKAVKLIHSMHTRCNQIIDNLLVFALRSL